MGLMEEQRQKKIFVAMLVVMMAVLIGFVYYESGVKGKERRKGTAYFIQSCARPGMTLEVGTLDEYGLSEPEYEWHVDDERLDHTGASYTLTEEDLERMISVTIRADGYEDQTLYAYCSRLPVLYLNVEGIGDADFQDQYKIAGYVLQGTGEDAENGYIEGTAQVKGRGNSSSLYPKKAFKLRLDKKEDLLGMGENKHWVLISNYVDHSLMRNTLACWVAKQMEVDAMDTRWVSLVLNGEYYGNYQLSEQVRSGVDRVSVTDYDQIADEVAKVCVSRKIIPPVKEDVLNEALKNDLEWLSTGVFTFEEKTYQIPDDIEIPALTGGVILEIDSNFDNESKFMTGTEQPVMFTSPESASTNRELAAFVQEYVQAIEDAICAEDYHTVYRGETVHYSDLADMDSILKYWLVNELFYNVDFGVNSMFFYKDVEGKAYMGPIWDFDWSSNGRWGAEPTTGWLSRLKSTRFTWFKSLIRDPYFIREVHALYWEYRPVFQQMLEDGGIIDQYYEYLAESGRKNEKIWPSDRGFEEDVYVFLKPWLEERLRWMDEQMETAETLARSLNQ